MARLRPAEKDPKKNGGRNATDFIERHPAETGRLPAELPAELALQTPLMSISMHELTVDSQRKCVVFQNSIGMVTSDLRCRDQQEWKDVVPSVALLSLKTAGSELLARLRA
jgi:hypothetical protein